jgi:hypothetical protein
VSLSLHGVIRTAVSFLPGLRALCQPQQFEPHTGVRDISQFAPQPVGLGLQNSGAGFPSNKRDALGVGITFASSPFISTKEAC